MSWAGTRIATLPSSPVTPGANVTLGVRTSVSGPGQNRSVSRREPGGSAPHIASTWATDAATMGSA